MTSEIAGGSAILDEKLALENEKEKLNVIEKKQPASYIQYNTLETPILESASPSISMARIVCPRTTVRAN